MTALMPPLPYTRIVDDVGKGKIDEVSRGDDDTPHKWRHSCPLIPHMRVTDETCRERSPGPTMTKDRSDD
ncbi:hypothetical protein B296_00045153 [Ensete ventricosum]|uniref:Uncharacterized protein n=1 Tax=Ensete ventricosum TaxID=4639 RepID=A0A426YNZ9_ENSVE|nr:hypothetical protein B296_00045153 [Ensete ventricosum]